MKNWQLIHTLTGHYDEIKLFTSVKISGKFKILILFQNQLRDVS